MKSTHENNGQDLEGNKKVRPMSAFVTSVKPGQKYLHEFPTAILTAIDNNLRLGAFMEIQKKRNSMQDDIQPSFSGFKLKVKNIHNVTQPKIISSRKTQKKVIRNNQRSSFSTKYQQKTLHYLKFPSQKTIISKQKVIPNKFQLQQKQDNAIEVYRILKQQQRKKVLEDSKTKLAFKKGQLKKIQQMKTQTKMKSPRVTFNYDGSIITVDPTRRALHNEVIECTGEEYKEIQIQQEKKNRSSYYSSQKEKLRKKKVVNEEDIVYPDEMYKKYNMLENSSQKYIKNFSKIPWNKNIIFISSNQGGKVRARRKSADQITYGSSIKNIAPPSGLTKKKIESSSHSTVKIMNNCIFQNQMALQSHKINQSFKILEDPSSKLQNSKIHSAKPSQICSNNHSHNKSQTKLNKNTKNQNSFNRENQQQIEGMEHRNKEKKVKFDQGFNCFLNSSSQFKKNSKKMAAYSRSKSAYTGNKPQNNDANQISACTLKQNSNIISNKEEYQNNPYSKSIIKRYGDSKITEHGVKLRKINRGQKPNYMRNSNLDQL